MEDLDPAAFREWFDGAQQPIGPESRHGTDARNAKPEVVVWTGNGPAIGWSGTYFGNSKTPGARHLQIGFTKPIEIGSVLARGGGSLSVLKPDASYPGALNDDSQWLPAQRLVEGKPSRAEASFEQYALWTLPPGTQTRALRFTHIARAADADYSGHLGGAWLLKERAANIAPFAVASTSGNNQKSALLNNERDESWGFWSNLDPNTPVPASAPVVSAQDPQFITLIWPEPVQINALAGLSSAFAAAEIQTYTGPADKHPREASESQWKTVASFEGIRPRYPQPLAANILPLGQTVTTRALRLRVTAPTPMGEAVGHLEGKTREGKLIWLAELMALSPQNDAPLRAVSMAAAPQTNPPIAVRFQLDKPGFVTLVIEDSDGRRVRNLVAETPFPAGENVAWWDGTDDLGRDVEAASHGVYKIPAQFVAPGQYRVRGLVRDAIVPRYEFAFYNAGQPAWETLDKTGGWLTNHTPPQAALFLDKNQSPTGAPLVYLGSYVSEGGSGLAWVDLNGKKVGGRGHVGGSWTAAPFLASDKGAAARPDVYAYVAAAWTSVKDDKKAEIRITGLGKDGDKDILRYEFDPRDVKNTEPELSGLAARDGLLYVSLPLQKQLLIADAKSGEIKSKTPLENARGLAFDAQGRLLVVAGNKVLRYRVQNGVLGESETIIAAGLQEPQQLAFDKEGRIYVSDWGNSHQVKMFDATGKLLRSFGKPGAPAAGKYDELHMNHPAGLALDENGRLWVAEKDHLPKRVSVWNADGSLWRAFYGPAKYGGGGMLDPRDPSLLLYADEGRGAMEFKLDWKAGTSRLQSVFYRPDADDLPLPSYAAAPEMAIYANNGRYFSNSYNSNPTNGPSINMIWKQTNGLARPVAAMGLPNNWDILKGEAFKATWPEGFDPNESMWARGGKNQALFVWTDENGDAQVQPAEVKIKAGRNGGITTMPDLSITVAYFEGQTLRFAPVGFTAQGAPRYDLDKGEVLLEDTTPPPSDGGGQALTDGKTTFAGLSSAEFHPFSLSGKSEHGVWSYPNLWPGLHPSHEAPVASQPGQLLGPTRLLGGLITPPRGEAGPLVATNSNLGSYYVFTADGLFVATIFKDFRQGQSWAIPNSTRDMDLSQLSQGPENFWPTWGQGPDGKIYIVDGGHSSILRLDGLDSIKRLPASTLAVSAADLQKAQTYLVDQEAARQKFEGGDTLQVALNAATPTVDGKLDDWTNAKWADIDRSGVAAFFNSTSKPYDISGALAIGGDRLFAAYRTGDANLLRNSGEVPTAPFKTGGALDLMIGTDSAADPKRTAPVAGDLRLLVTMANDKPLAVLYRAVAPGATEKVPFSSPWRTISFDEVKDVSDQIQLAGSEGNYEFSIPLSVLGLKPQTGQSLSGDIGVLRGNGFQTTARVYWNNKATGIVSDVPSEAQLTPHLWGKLELMG